MLGPDSRKQLGTFARIGAVGIELGLSVAIGALGGRWLDGKLETTPYLTLTGLLLGLIAGFKSLLQTVRRYQKQQQQAQRDSDDE